MFQFLNPQKRARSEETQSADGHKRHCQPDERTPVLQEDASSNLSSSTDDSSSEQDALEPYQRGSERRSGFIYRPLQLDKPSIRLVDILPLGQNGDVRCAIKHTILGTARETSPSLVGPIAAPKSASVSYDYTCLSYVWGPPGDERSIFLNGRSFMVRKNLWDFLYAVARIRSLGEEDYAAFQAPELFIGAKKRDLSEKDHADRKSQRLFGVECFRSLWIDALCIDQTSVLERNHQVQQMGQVYSSASRVIAWFGNDRGLAGLLSQCRRTALEHRCFLTEDSLTSVRTLCDHFYWKRAWITQEVILARNLYLFAGHEMVMVEDLSKAGDHLASHLSVRFASLRRLLIKTSRGYRSQKILENFELFRHKQCSEPRDLAYSLLSVSRDGHRLQVDYGCSLVDLARNILSVSEDEICLRRAVLLTEVLGIASGEPDADCLLLESDEATTQKDMSPCAQCGDDATMESPRLGPSSVTRVRCFCLQCNHSVSSEFRHIHRSGHFGHLILIWAAAVQTTTHNWHLFWTPMGGGPWRKLQQHKIVRTNDEGRFESLVLSIGVVYEIMTLASLDAAQRDALEYRAVLETYEPSWNTKWKVAM